MTPSRIKRSSKAPNRFSSDNSNLEKSNPNGESILDKNDRTSSIHGPTSVVKVNNKLKLITREPLKVKLPKLKRPSQSHPTKEHAVKSNNTEIKIHKIKLPSLSSKKLSSSGGNGHTGNKIKSTTRRPQSLINMEQNNSIHHDSHAKNTPQNKDASPIKLTKSNAGHATDQPKSVNRPSPKPTSLLSTLTAPSKASSEDKSSSSANTSFSSSDDAEDNNPRMEIVVTQPEQSNGSGIHCPCGVDDDLGVMVECESCSTWQHGHCINVGTEDEAYEGYVCAFCISPADDARESLRQLTIGDKFQLRFKLLESLRKNNDTQNNNEKNFSSGDITEVNAILTLEDLSQALKDLYRVLSSLKVKWKLLTSQEYELELRIWQNPFWSDDEQQGHDKGTSIYFLDKCKSHLKLNIRNMVQKLSERCQLIDYAITSKKSFEGIETELEMKKIKYSLEDVSSCVREFETKLRSLSN